MSSRRTLAATLAILFTLARDAYSSGQKKKGADQESMRPNPAAASVDSTGFASCPAGSPLGEMSLTVRSGSGDRPLPFQNIVHLTEGDSVDYAPVDHGRGKREGEIALVLVPTKISGKEELLVTDPKAAEKPQHWDIPSSMALAVFVYGPQGLSRKRVKSFLSQDDSLIAQLAEYADKTAQTEALITALSDAETSSASMNAALNGFASQYGVSVQIDKTAPRDAQAQALFSAMNPQLSAYSPLASNNAARASQTASLATAAAGLFFGSPVGLLAGGTSMLLDLRSIAFPDTQFRSSFAQGLKTNHVNLCGERGATPPRTRAAYLWASRIPNAPKPDITIGEANYLPLGQKSPLPITLPDPQWKYLQRARAWYLQSGSGQTFPIDITKLQNQKSIEIDLSKAGPDKGKLAAGDYQLAGFWDWEKFNTNGTVRVRTLSKLDSVHLEAKSQDELFGGGGKVPVRFSGGDFEFVNKVEIKKAHDEFAQAEAARLVLPKGIREGPQSSMDVLVDTKDRMPGDYQLLVYQGEGEPSQIPFKILPALPAVSNLPMIAIAGTEEQHFALKGERLDSIASLQAPGVTFTIGDVSANGSQRALSLRLSDTTKAGGQIPVQVFVKDRSEPLHFSDGMEVTGPLPVIASSKLAAPTGLAVALHEGEYPAGVSLSATLDVKNLDRQSSIALACAGSGAPAATLHVGQQRPDASLQQLSPDQLYLLFDTAALPAGCHLQATIDNGRGSSSQPYDLARIVRLPQVDTFEPAPSSDGKTWFNLKGRNLEMIDSVGWDPTNKTVVSSVPAPVSGESQKQQLTLQLPPPQTGKDELYVWLRGDKDARASTLKPVTPVPPSAPPAAAPPPVPND